MNDTSLDHPRVSPNSEGYWRDLLRLYMGRNGGRMDEVSAALFIDWAFDDETWEEEARDES